MAGSRLKTSIAGAGSHMTAQTLAALALVFVASPTFAQVGPQPTITCPSGAVSLAPGSSIQAAVNANPGTSTFCLLAGIHFVTGPITPKSGNTFIGEYGAIVDGSKWTASTPDYYAIFLAHTLDIDDVTIRNLVIRNATGKRCIHAAFGPDRWTIDHTEITGCQAGAILPRGAIFRANYCHHNSGTDSGGAMPNGCYFASNADGLLIEGNEIAYNGAIQKVMASNGATFRNNYLHHNGTCIWFDGDNVNVLVEGNTCEDTTGEGIWHEVGGSAIIRNNIVRRSGVSCIFLSTSRDVEIYGNTCEGNWRGLNLFFSCAALGGYAGDIGHDLRNNSVHDNTVIAGTRDGTLVSSLSTWGCTTTQAGAYLNGSKSNLWARNHYVVPSGNWWMWGDWKSWTQWQAIPQDAGGALGSAIGPSPPSNLRIAAP
jgi:parallel beta-helix repeat protein